MQAWYRGSQTLHLREPCPLHGSKQSFGTKGLKGKRRQETTS